MTENRGDAVMRAARAVVDDVFPKPMNGDAEREVRDEAPEMQYPAGPEDFDQANGEQQQRRRIVLEPASGIKIRAVTWLWDTTPEGQPPTSQGRIPMGEFSLAAGKAGIGKSQFGVWLAAQITRGSLPGALYGRPRSVVYAATEDSWEMTIAPRLVAAGADLERVYRARVQSDADLYAQLTLPMDTSAMFRSMGEHDVALAVLDPVLSLIDGSVNDYRAKEVRAALEPLVAECHKSGVTIVGLAHFTKATNFGDPLDSVAGSGAFGQLIRAALGFARLQGEDVEQDEQPAREEFVLSQIKNNLGHLSVPSLKYVIQPATVETDDGKAYVSRFHLTGEESEKSVRDALIGSAMGSGAGQKVDKQDAAWQWLKGALASGPLPATEAKAKGAAAGHAPRTLERAISDAKKRGEAATPRDGFGRGSAVLWCLPEHESAILAKNSHTRHTREMASMAEVGEYADSTAPDETTDGHTPWLDSGGDDRAVSDAQPWLASDDDELGVY